MKKPLARQRTSTVCIGRGYGEVTEESRSTGASGEKKYLSFHALGFRNGLTRSELALSPR
jgi:hypothetical protein